MLDQIKIHGTYPLDTWGVWAIIARQITIEVVAKLLNLPAETKLHEVCRSCEGAKTKTREDHSTYDCSHCGGTGETDRYLWLNKGFVVLGADAPQGGKADMRLHLMEMLGGSPEVSGIKPGSRAIYLHDGKYLLLIRRGNYRRVQIETRTAMKFYGTTARTTFVGQTQLDEGEDNYQGFLTFAPDRWDVEDGIGNRLELEIEGRQYVYIPTSNIAEIKVLE